jgi:DNA mismatch repair protein MutS2
MDDNTLRLLEFAKVLDHLGSYCATALGRKQAAALRPLSDADAVRARLRETSQMKTLLEDGARLPLAGIRDLDPVLNSLHERGRPLDEEEILGFKDTLESSRSLREFFLGLDDGLDSLRELGRRIREFDSLLARFELTVDARGRIVDGASAKLAEIRRRIRATEQRIEGRLGKIIASPQVRNLLRERKFFFRNGRFVLPVRSGSRGAVRGIIHDSSQSGNTVFVEPDEIVELGNELGDLRSQERREISRILWELTRDVLDRDEDLRELLDLLGRIDLTVAKARMSVEFDHHPADPDPSGILLRRARHPILLMLATRKSGAEEGATSEEGSPPPDREGPQRRVVPIDVRLGDDFDVLIITGPNTGGKTVTLKTVGLLVLMNQAGLHIPAAKGSRLGLFRRVFADIGDEQSLEQSLSTFSGHMANISGILAEAGDDTLILLDELGAGTDPAEGAALGVGILDHLLRRGARAIITTHIGSLKSYAYRHERAANGCVEFDVETLAPTYRLFIGQPGNSNAVTIARRIGMDPEVLARAEQILEGQRDGTEELIRQLEESLKAAEGKRIESEDLREEGLRIRESAERVRRELEERRRNVEREADAEIDEVLGRLRRGLEDDLRALRNAPRPFDEAAGSIERILDETLRTTPLARKREAFIRKLKKEDWVYIPRFRQKGRVARIHRENRTVSVRIGSMALEVPFEDVSWVDT